MESPALDSGFDVSVIGSARKARTMSYNGLGTRPHAPPAPTHPPQSEPHETTTSPEHSAHSGRNHSAHVSPASMSVAETLWKAQASPTREHKMQARFDAQSPHSGRFHSLSGDQVKHKVTTPAQKAAAVSLSHPVSAFLERRSPEFMHATGHFEGAGAELYASFQPIEHGSEGWGSPAAGSPAPGVLGGSPAVKPSPSPRKSGLAMFRQAVQAVEKDVGHWGGVGGSGAALGLEKREHASVGFGVREAARRLPWDPQPAARLTHQPARPACAIIVGSAKFWHPVDMPAISLVRRIAKLKQSESSRLSMSWRRNETERRISEASSVSSAAHVTYANGRGKADERDDTADRHKKLWPSQEVAASALSGMSLADLGFGAGMEYLITVARR